MKHLILLLSLISLSASAGEHGNSPYEPPSDDEPQYYSNAYGQRIELYRPPLGSTAVRPAEAKRPIMLVPELEQHRGCDSPECAPGDVRPNAPPAAEDNEYRQEAG